MGRMGDPNCQSCEGSGWVYDWLGGCGDPECCGGPAQVQCLQCVNDWSPSDPPEDDRLQQPNA